MRRPGNGRGNYPGEVYFAVDSTTWLCYLIFNLIVRFKAETKGEAACRFKYRQAFLLNA